ncbi:MAG: tetratricopeptide repeat protein [Candidatus Melainabacteria bacterium]|nr:tetratricopeptide repeat protein [Candidatus Melainabacteria bacterium]
MAIPSLGGNSQDGKPVSQAAMRKAEVVFEKGHKALDRKDHRAAERCYRQAVSLNPSEGRYHRQLGLLLLRMSRGQEAEREALIATSSDPEDWRSLLVLANIYHLEGRDREEVATCKRALAILPEEEKELHGKLQQHVADAEIAMRQSAEKERHKRQIEEQRFKNAY